MKRAGSLLLLLIGLGVVAGVAAWFVFVPREKPPAPVRPPFSVPATLVAVATRDVTPTVLLTGNVRTAAHAHVAFLVAGAVKAVEALEGAVIEEGKVLATLDDGDQKARLALAEAGVTWATRRLERLEAGSREEERQRLRATFTAAEAELAFATREMDRGVGLRDRQVISPGEYDALVSARDSARGRRDAAAEALREAEAGTRPEDIAVQQAEVAQKVAERDVAQRELEKTVLRAPFTAHVVRRDVSVGDHVGAGVTVFELVDLDHREVVLEIPSSSASRLGENARVEITLEEAPAFHLETQIDAVVAAAEEPSRNVRAIARLEPSEDPTYVLRPGAFVRARVSLRTLAGVLVVPADALRVMPMGTIVVRATSKPPAPPPGAPAAGAPPPTGSPPAGAPQGPPPLFAEWVMVRVLGEDASGAAVEALGGPLVAGEQIVVLGADLAFPGVPLRPVPAPTAAAPHGGPPPGAGAPGAGRPGAGGSSPAPSTPAAAGSAPAGKP